MAFTKTYGPDPFEFAGHTVEVEFETLPGETPSYLRDLIRQDKYGTAEVVLLGAAIKRLTVGGQQIIKQANRAARRAGNPTSSENLPSLYDRETWESLTDRLLKFVVAHEFWLTMKEPFDAHFGQYAEDEEERDPTVSPVETKTDS